MKINLDNIRSKYVIDDNTGCWNWLGSRDSGGYGHISRNGKKLRAHRFYYSLFIGEIPDHMHVCHECDNPGCVNPIHLFLCTHQENMDDKVKKNRSWRPIGELGAINKLNTQDVYDIITSDLSIGDISKKYKLSYSGIQSVLTGKTWGHVFKDIPRRPVSDISNNWKTRKLSTDDVISIFKSKEKPCILAKRYGVLPLNITRIRSGLIWKKITSSINVQ